MPSAVMETSQSGKAAAEASMQQTGESKQSVPEHAKEKTDSGTAAGDRRTGKYLTFVLGREEFAIQVLKVREIMGILDIILIKH